ncbi:MAG: hypothetical protein ONB17_06715 [candidate division KSB1 bacterium]|nr:hypothetical protein [candidate division KSB1 bacterium]
MRHMIIIVASCLAFLTLVVCVFRDVPFSTTLMRTAVVAGVALVVGFVVVSIWVWFSIIGLRRDFRQSAREDTPQTEPQGK